MNISNTLKQLMSAHKLNTMELARRTGIGQPVIYRLISGETDNPKIITLCALADYFGISVNQLIGDAPLPITHGRNKQKVNKQVTEIPLINWDEVIDWRAKHDKKHETIFANITPNANLYALKMQDNSMDPVFSKGTILIIDGNKEPSDRSYVVIKLKKEKQIIFRQILIEDDYQYLKPFNPDTEKYKIRLLAKGDKCCGVLIQAQKDYINT